MAKMRKIPARKHHGIRDPLKQREDREKKLKNVVNNPPDKGNDQKASFKFTQFKKLADNAKAGKKFKKLHSGQEDKPKSCSSNAKSPSRTENKIRSIKQFIDEPDEEYLKRVNRITSESLREAQYEAKYGVTVVRDAKTGMISLKKQPKNEIDELLKQKEKERYMGKVGRKGKKIPLPNPLNPKLAKELIKQAIKEDNEDKIKEHAEHEEYKRDVFKFGEIVHAPPTLSTLPRKAQKSETVPRPGMKNNLLLKSLLVKPVVTVDATKTGTAKTVKPKRGVTLTKPQMRGKRKDLPEATRKMLETEQNKFIELYRNLKKTKEKST